MSNRSDRPSVRAERRLMLLDLFQREAFLTVGDISTALGVSPMTVRRDLRILAGDGLVRLEHGGALLIPGSPIESIFRQRENQCSDEKRAIGRVAAGLIAAGDVIGLDAGTTGLAVARCLRPPEPVTVVTHSLPALYELAGRPRIELIALGGLLQDHTLGFAGPSVTTALRTLRLHTLFLAATGFTLNDGMTCSSLYETDTKRALIQVAQRVVLIADHSKLGRVYLHHVASLDAVHDIVTDTGMPPQDIEELEKRGIVVHRAGPSDNPGGTMDRR